MNTPSEAPLESSIPSNLRASTKALVMALVLAAGIGIGIISHGINKGYNDNPRGPHEKGIVIKDGKVNRIIMCLRELFHDKVTQPAFKNKWRAEHCDKEKMEELSKAQDSLLRIVDERKTALQQAGIDPGVETWFSDGGKMRIEIDEESKKAGINAGKIEE